MQSRKESGWDWPNWTSSERMLVSTSLATLFTLLLAWRDVGFASKSGISTGEGWVAILLVSYPTAAIMNGQKVKKILAIFLMIIAILWGIINLVSGYEFIEADGFLFVEDVWLDFNGIGAYLFVPIAIMGLVGAVKYRVPIPEVVAPLTPPSVDMGPDVSLVGSVDESGYEWIQHNGQDYWRTEGAGSHWTLHE